MYSIYFSKHQNKIKNLISQITSNTLDIINSDENLWFTTVIIKQIITLL